jgi:type VI secretion system protein VasI
MRIIATTLLLFSSSTFPMFAEAYDVEACHQFSSDIARLGCYDKATSFGVPAEGQEAEVAVESTESAPPKIESKWVVRSETSPLDDSTNVALRLESNGNIRSRYGAPGPMSLHIQCRENTTMLYIHFNGLFMSDHQHGTVTYRLGDKKAQTKRMRESNDHSALGLWNGGTAIPFVKAMFGSDKLLIQATPHSESAVLANFTISGLENEIEPLRKSCGW